MIAAVGPPVTRLLCTYSEEQNRICRHQEDDAAAIGVGPLAREWPGSIDRPSEPCNATFIAGCLLLRVSVEI